MPRVETKSQEAQALKGVFPAVVAWLGSHWHQRREQIFKGNVGQELQKPRWGISNGILT